MYPWTPMAKPISKVGIYSEVECFIQEMSGGDYPVQKQHVSLYTIYRHLV